MREEVSDRFNYCIPWLHSDIVHAPETVIVFVIIVITANVLGSIYKLLLVLSAV